MSENIVVSSDQGRTIEVNQGAMIEIRLEEKPTTGYQWEVGEIDSKIVEFIDSSYLLPSRTAIGAGGTRTFRFRARFSGCGQIQLRLRRSWDPIDIAIEEFKVYILVQAIQ